MTVACFDSSAFVKLFIDEPGSGDAERIWNEVDVAVASRLALPEVSAALTAAGRAGRLDREAERTARRAWAGYWAAVQVVEVTAAIAIDAAALAGRLVLGGADAVHLASALALVEADPILVTWDQRLGSAAVEAGLAVVPGHF